MKYLIIICTLLTSCGPSVEQDYSSSRYEKICETRCIKEMGTKLSFVGIRTGNCYCE